MSRVRIASPALKNQEIQKVYQESFMYILYILLMVVEKTEVSGKLDGRTCKSKLPQRAIARNRQLKAELRQN